MMLCDVPISIINEDNDDVRYLKKLHPAIQYIKNNKLKTIDLKYNSYAKIKIISSKITGILFDNYIHNIDNIPHTIKKL